MRKLVLGLVLAMLVGCGVLLQFRALLPDEMIPDVAAYPNLEAVDTEALAEEPLTLAFSEGGHFYPGDIEVAITASDPAAAIYYTLDGNDPTEEDTPYTRPVTIKAWDGVGCVALRAVAVAGDKKSAIKTHSYFIGEGVDERFSTLVFSLCTDEANLYDYETGIFVEGKLRDDFMAENPDIGAAEWYYPANINASGAEWERPVSVEVLTPSGDCVVSQDAGLRLYGGGTRHYAQKSLRLIARSQYGEGRFEYDFFPGLTGAAYGAPITSFNSLVLRNGGNDREEAMLRNELGLQLATDAGYGDTAAYTPAAVFLNGEYYGFAWLQERVDEHTLAEKYLAPNRQIEILENAETHVDLGDWYYQLAREDVTYDFGSEDFLAAFAGQVDVDDLLFYYAYEIYLANLDWPQNNMRIWRYAGQAPAAAGELDGRWRHIIYDTEYGYGYHDRTWDTDALEIVIGDDGSDKYSPLLRALLHQPELSARFSAMVSDIAYQHAEASHVADVMHGIWAEAEAELAVSLKSSVEPGFNTPANLAASRQKILDFFEKRPDFMMGDLERRFGYDETYRVVAEGPAVINTRTDGEGLYYTACAVPVTPVLEKYEVFDHWLVNGEAYTGDETLQVTADMAEGGVVTVEPVTHTEVPALRLVYAYDDGGPGGCTVENTGDEAASMAGLYLSDDANNLTRWAFPDITLKPGRQVELVGAARIGQDALLKVGVDFNISRGEVVFISDSAGDVIDWLVVE